MGPQQKTLARPCSIQPWPAAEGGRQAGRPPQSCLRSQQINEWRRGSSKRKEFSQRTEAKDALTALASFILTSAPCGNAASYSSFTTPSSRKPFFLRLPACPPAHSGKVGDFLPSPSGCHAPSQGEGRVFLASQTCKAGSWHPWFEQIHKGREEGTISKEQHQPPAAEG